MKLTFEGKLVFIWIFLNAGIVLTGSVELLMAQHFFALTGTRAEVAANVTSASKEQLAKFCLDQDLVIRGLQRQTYHSLYYWLGTTALNAALTFFYYYRLKQKASSR